MGNFELAIWRIGYKEEQQKKINRKERKGNAKDAKEEQQRRINRKERNGNAKDAKEEQRRKINRKGRLTRKYFTLICGQTL
jgi:hypothetical protein